MERVLIDYDTDTYEGAIRIADFGSDIDNFEIAFKTNTMSFTRNFHHEGDTIFLTCSIDNVKYLLGTAILGKRSSYNPFGSKYPHSWELTNIQRFNPIDLMFLMKATFNRYWVFFKTPHDIKEHKELVVMLALLVNQAKKEKI